MTLCAIVVFANLVRFGLRLAQGRVRRGRRLDRAGAPRRRLPRILRRSPAEPDLTVDDPTAPVVEIPALKQTLLAGLHFLLPVALLIWCLLVETLSPGLSAFYASVFLIAILLTQKPLTAMFQRQGATRALARAGWDDWSTASSAARAT